MITLISASAFPRGVSVDGDMRHGAGLVLALLLAAIFTGATIFAAAYLFTGTRFWPSSAGNSELALLWIGAVATGLHSLFQGIFLKLIGPRATFLPLTAAQLSAAVAISFVDAERASTLIEFIVAAQCLPIILFAAANMRAIKSLNWSAAVREPAFIRRYLRETTLFGITATAYVVVLLLTREAWRGTVDTSVAAYVFFAMQLSDVYMQIAFYLFSSARAGHGLGAFAEHHCGVALRLRMPLFIALSAALALVVVTGLFSIQTSARVAILAILAQGAVDLVRLPVSTYFIRAIQSGSAALYAFIHIPPLMVLVITYISLYDILPPATLFYCQLAFACSVTLFSLVANKLWNSPASAGNSRSASKT